LYRAAQLRVAKLSFRVKRYDVSGAPDHESALGEGIHVRRGRTPRRDEPIQEMVEVWLAQPPVPKSNLFLKKPAVLSVTEPVVFVLLRTARKCPSLIEHDVLEYDRARPNMCSSKSSPVAAVVLS